MEKMDQKTKNKLNKLRDELFVWYPEHKRDLPWRKTKNPYYIWISEIMLQQTRVEAVKTYYDRFIKALPTIKDLANVSDDELMKLWEGLGYYSRARNIKKAALQIEEKFGGAFPSDYEGIHSLAGIGDYTAGAIGSICFDLPTPAVDGNVLRVYSRVLGDDSNIDMESTKKMVRNNLATVYPKENSGILNQALMEIGATVCIPNGAPHCEQCPLASFCQAKKNKLIDKLPVRKEKTKRKIVDMTVFVLKSGDTYAIHKRTSKGLLALMWEFPNTDKAMDKQEASDYLGKLGVKASSIIMEQKYTHIFSHVEWRMTAYYFTCEKKLKDYTWKTLQEIDGTYALPTAFREFRQRI